MCTKKFLHLGGTENGHSAFKRFIPSLRRWNRFTFSNADLLGNMNCNFVVVTNRFAGEPAF